MYKGDQPPGCSRFGETDAFVPFQPNVNPDGTPNPAAGRDDAILYGAARRDPGGLPLGTLEHMSFDRFYNAPGARRSRRRCTCARAAGTLRPRHGGADGAGRLDASTPPEADRADQRAARVDGRRFTVTPAGGATVNADVKLAARAAHGRRRPATRTTSCASSSPVEGRFQRWGKWEEYDQLARDTAPQARRARPLGGGPVDGRRRDDDAPGRRPQLVRRRRRAARCS